jgi:hypothetical protein
MLFGPQAGQPAEDHKLCHYRCDCGATEFKIRLPRGDRKLRRWCKHCRKFIYPIAITRTTTTERELRTSTPRPGRF